MSLLVAQQKKQADTLVLVVGEEVHHALCMPYRFAVRAPHEGEPWRVAWTPLMSARSLVAWLANGRMAVVHVGDCASVPLFACWLLGHAGGHLAPTLACVREGERETRASLHAWSHAFGRAHVATF